MSVVVTEKDYKKKVGCVVNRLQKGGDQRPRSIIVKINRGELKREVRGEREIGRMGDTHKTKTKGRTETTRRRAAVDLVAPKARGQKLEEGRLLCAQPVVGVMDQLGHCV